VSHNTSKLPYLILFIENGCLGLFLDVEHLLEFSN